MSAYLDWSDEYATGIQAIDGEHQTLFMMVNALHGAMENDLGNEEFAGLFRRLTLYVDSHFAREERLMRAAAYEGFDGHVRQHRALTKTLRRLATEFEADPENFATEDLLDFLKNWLSQHVLKTDMDYVPCLQAATE